MLSFPPSFSLTDQTADVSPPDKFNFYSEKPTHFKSLTARKSSKSTTFHVAMPADASNSSTLIRISDDSLSFLSINPLICLHFNYTANRQSRWPCIAIVSTTSVWRWLSVYQSDAGFTLNHVFCLPYRARLFPHFSTFFVCTNTHTIHSLFLLGSPRLPPQFDANSNYVKLIKIYYFFAIDNWYAFECYLSSEIYPYSTSIWKTGALMGNGEWTIAYCGPSLVPLIAIIVCLPVLFDFCSLVIAENAHCET